MFICKIAKKNIGIKMQKFADHPIGICRNPDNNGQIMANFAHQFPCSVCNNNSNGQCRKNHGNTQWFPYHTPANIFQQPKNNM